MIRIKGDFPFTLSVVVLALFGLLGWALTASPRIILAEHDSTNFYPAESWAADVTYSIGARSGDLNTQEAKLSILSGDDNWDATTGAWLDFIWIGEDTSVTWDTNTCITVPDNGEDLYILTDDLSGLGAANAAVCTGGGSDFQEATIRLDDTRSDWYTGSSTNVPGTEFDLRSVITHEFGHAGGFGIGSAPDHFTDSGICSGSTRQTMCSGLPAGTSYKRTLETHDKEAFANEY